MKIGFIRHLSNKIFLFPDSNLQKYKLFFFLIFHFYQLTSNEIISAYSVASLKVSPIWPFYGEYIFP